jgi:hypothetical protein
MTGGMEQLHWQLEGAFRHDGGGLSHKFLKSVEVRMRKRISLFLRKMPFCATKGSFYRDRLGTNFGKLKKRVLFLSFPYACVPSLSW